MCTVSVIPLGAGFRLVTNRDESPERAPALPPEWREVGGVRAVWPIDGAAGGTWVAAGEQGLALALLNVNLLQSGGEPGPGPERRLSRGEIIPRLIASASAGEAAAGLARLELERYEPFRLVAVDAANGVRVVESRWDARSLESREFPAGPACFVSSGLGDRLVEPRLPLFAEMVASAGAFAEQQDAFHAHRWPERPEISVMMDRGAARTVSVTRVAVRPVPGGGRFEIDMRHEAVAGDRPAACRG
jgi:hypothetical protein